jgi:uncharacterized repeat protein (TIGR01451 family)
MVRVARLCALTCSVFATVVLTLVVWTVARPTRITAQSAGLVASYSFNEGSGTTVTDVSGHNLNGTIVGATWTAGGRFGNALSFDGSTSYVDLGNPSALQLTGSVTIEAWIMAAANPANDGQIVAKSNGAGWEFKTTPDTGRETFGMQVTGTSGASAQRYSTTVRSLNTWYHLAGVYNATAGTLSLYVNGVLDNGTLIGTVPFAQLNQAVNVNIGRRTGGYYFNGIIDELRIYNRALSQAEIQTDMNTPVDVPVPTPDLTVASAHSGTFTQGQTGASYTLTVSNTGTGPSNGIVTVTDALPGGLTASAMDGPGWTCNVAAVSCTRSDTLAAGASYQAVTLTVNVAGNTPALVTNIATVSGGGEINVSNDTASDPTAVAIGGPAVAPVFVTEGNFAVDQNTTGPNRASVSLKVSGTNTLLIAAFHAEFDGGDTNWIATDDGVPGTVLVITDGYTGGAGNQRFRIWYWINPPQGSNSIVVQNSYTGSNELTLSAVLFSNVEQTNPLGDLTLDISTKGRTSESETVTTTGNDLVVHVIADALFIRGTLGAGEVSVSVANDGLQKTSTGDGDASLWISTKSGTFPSTTVSSSGWASSPPPAPRVINGVGIVVHGIGTTDTTPPTVSITSPVNGAVSSGTISVMASASDNQAMAGVQFLLDGANLGAEVLGAGPTYTLNWNTTSSTNGAHTLSALGRDVSNNTAVATDVSVTVSNTVANALLASYSFNAGSGTTTADSSGNGLTGTISGATWTPAGMFGNALSFSGSNSYVDLGTPTLLNGTGSMTWAAWVKATATPRNDGNIVARQNNNNGWQLKTTADTGPQTFAIAVSGSSGFAQRNSVTIRSLNTWYHVAGVYNAANRTLDIFVNGVLDNGILTGSVPAVQSLPNSNVYIGRRSNGYYFAGVIDEVQIYNRALSASEILAIMNTPLP